MAGHIRSWKHLLSRLVIKKHRTMTSLAKLHTKMDMLLHSSSTSSLQLCTTSFSAPPPRLASLFLVKVAQYETFSLRRFRLCRRLCARLMAYLQYLIYTAPFKASHDWPLGVVHAKYYADWAALFSALGREKAYCKMLMKKLEVWYEKHPPGKGPKSEQSFAQQLQQLV
jgi:hypothetical protein